MKIAIACASRLGAEALRRAVGEETPHEVIWVAPDVVSAATKCQADRPDLLLLDVAVPTGRSGMTSRLGGGLDAVALTRRVMTDSPCAILLITPAKGGGTTAVYEALGLGALDAVRSPVLDIEGELIGRGALIGKIRTLEKLVDPGSARDATPAAGLPGRDAAALLVGVAASTGGPEALAVVLSALPKPFEAALLVVQHIDRDFASGLAGWLTDRTGFPVELAREGDVPSQGVAYLAAGDGHLVLRSDRTLGYVSEPHSVHRPSADVLFGSLADHAAVGVAAVLTGMGRDGAEGLLRLRRAGWSTLAQDQKTSVVFGMPMAAAELLAAESVLPLPAMGPTIATLVAQAARRR